MTDPAFAALSARFLARVAEGLEAARAALVAGDRETLRRELHSLFAAAGIFEFNDIAQLAFRAESLCELQPLPLSILTDLLDAIDDARCTHAMMSTAANGFLAISGG
jgi:HPt (histidine-containing phosphotransfer) domain-containing protein